MRDITRISLFCEELTDLWKKCPDMRFGQLVVNALGADPFYIEDNDALEKIRAFVLLQDSICLSETLPPRRKEIATFMGSNWPPCSIKNEKR